MKKLIFIMFVLSLFSCAKIKRGEIVQKEYKEAHTITNLVPVTRLVGKTTVTTLENRITHHSAKFIIIVTGEIEPNKIETQTFYTSKIKYYTLKVGQTVYTEDL